MASSEYNLLTVSGDLLQTLAGELQGEWKDVARYLGVSDGSLHNKEEDNKGNIREAKYQILASWKRANGSDATHSSLAEALKKSGRKDLSEIVIQDSSAEKRKMRRAETNEQAEMKAQFVKELQCKYESWSGEIQPAPFRHEKYDLDKLFVPTGIKYLEEKDGEQENWTMLKDYKTVFTDPQIKSKRRVIDGEPGYGKSTLALQIAKDWCKGVAPMDAYDLVILVRLRQFKNVPSIYSVIKRFLLPKDSTLTEDDIKNILDSSSTLVLLDGYDEYPDREKKDTIIHLIMNGEMLQEHEVVVTTRISCLPPSHTNTRIKRFRLTGFDDDSRKTYFQNLVSRDAGITIRNENSVPVDLCNNPLFVAMFSFMVKINERFRNLQTVTHFFRHVIKCFRSHWESKTTEETPQDHSKLDEVAFEGLSGDAQQISWGKSKLTDNIGKDLYDEYVGMGILIEEEIFYFDTLEYNTETRFFHKLFAEWYAAHHFAKVASQPDTEFKPWPKKNEPWNWLTAADPYQPHPAENSNNVQSLKSLNPDDVHYLYRFTCGLNPAAAVKIIHNLSTNPDYHHYALLCWTEWGCSFEEIQDTARLLCSQRIMITQTDSLLLQQSIVSLMCFASSRKIPVTEVLLIDCLSVDSTGNLRVQPYNLSLPVIDTIRLLSIKLNVRMTEEKTDSILQYAAKCPDLKKLRFVRCWLPQYVKKTDSVSVLRSRKVRVLWSPCFGWYLLNLSSCRWEASWDGPQITDELYDEEDGAPMTDEQYREEFIALLQYKEVAGIFNCGKLRKLGPRGRFDSHVIPSATVDDNELNIPMT